MENLKTILESKPKVENYDYQPYGYINALQNYIDKIEKLINHTNPYIEWWGNLSSSGRTRMCDIHTEIVGDIRRWETLTDREIQMLYESEHCT